MRLIKSILDVDLNRHLSADAFFEHSTWKTNALRRKETARFQQGDPAYRCSLCNGAVYARKGGFRGVDHFSHRKGEGLACSCHTPKGESLRAINARKFGGRQESKLHQDLKLLIARALEQDERFQGTKVEKSAVLGDRHSTQPDVFSIYGNRQLALELQLSTTQVPIIEGREAYNKSHGIFTIWVFHDFEKFRELATSEDIYVVNFFNAFELDGEAIAETKNTGVLHLKAWWRSPESAAARDQQSWVSKLVSIHDLHWHDGAKKAYAFDFLRAEAIAQRSRYSALIKRFEPCWLTRRNNGDAWARKVELAAYKRITECLGDLWDVALDQVEEWRFFDVLDRLFEVRDGRVYFGNQNLKGRVDTILETWPWFTDALVAVVETYQCREVLDWPRFWEKVQRNKNNEDSGIQKYRQRHAFNPAFRFLFPEAAAALYQDI